MFFKGKATFCPTIYWVVCGEVELRRDSSSQPSSEDVSSILFSNHRTQLDSSMYSNSKARLASTDNTGLSSSTSLRSTGDSHNSQTKSIKNRLSCLDQYEHPSHENNSQHYQNQLTRIGYLVENSERQKGVLVVCNLFEESLSKNCSELEVSWVTRRSQIQQGQILYAPKVKTYKQEMVDEDSIQYFIVARYVKLVSRKSAIYQFFESTSKSTSLTSHQLKLQPPPSSLERNSSKKRAFADASTQFYRKHDEENVENFKRIEPTSSKKVKTTVPETSAIAVSNRKEKFRQRIKAIKKKIMKKVETHSLPLSIPRVKLEMRDADMSVIMDSTSPSYFNNGFISDVVVISDDEGEDVQPLQKGHPVISGMTPLICSETPIMTSATVTRVKNDISISEEENDEINLSSSSPITLSMLYSTANQVKEMCSILDKSPLLVENSQKEEHEEILTSENILYTQEQAPFVDKATSSSDATLRENCNEEQEYKETNPQSDNNHSETQRLNETPQHDLNNSVVKEESPQ